MDQVFLKVLDNSWTAGWMILAVILLRMMQKRAPKWTVCLFWGLVALRLVLPFQIESALSLVPGTKPMQDEFTYPAVPKAAVGKQAVKPMAGEDFKPDLTANANPVPLWTTCRIIWMIGTAFMLAYASAGFFMLKKKVLASLKVSGCVYTCDDVQAPFILGILRPRIYLPSRIDKDTAAYVIKHEKAHLQRLDHFWKPFGFIILSVYWFHPLCWAAYILMCRDIEYACDEKAAKDMDRAQRADYCQALLTCSTKLKKITACPVAFGETGVKGRIRSVLHYKKPAVWIAAASLAACALTAVCFMTTQKTQGQAGISQADMQAQTADSFQNAEPSSAKAGTQSGDLPSAAETETELAGNRETNQNQSAITRQKLDYIVGHAASMSREGYQEVSITYVDNASAGWDYFSENPWETSSQRDRLAQAALQELYTLTGCQLKECVYTTDGRSKFIFGKSADAVRRSTAFYTRDYGWVLAGDNTPYMSFVNARRVWYSDIQQLDSPYNDPNYQGHGAVPAWFLDHSGVYQGHKIKGFDTFELEDPVFTHVSLKFDGGYYIIEMDDAIESVSTISGPYYESGAASKDALPEDSNTQEDGTESNVFNKNKNISASAAQAQTVMPANVQAADYNVMLTLKVYNLVYGHLGFVQ